jgi:hypothetical protein
MVKDGTVVGIPDKEGIATCAEVIFECKECKHRRAQFYWRHHIP